MKQLADKMSELVIFDSLTGIRNKTAYAGEAERLERELAEDPALDRGVEDVLKRADREMYEMKKAMKALREDEV